MSNLLMINRGHDKGRLFTFKIDGEDFEPTSVKIISLEDIAMEIIGTKNIGIRLSKKKGKIVACELSDEFITALRKYCTEHDIVYCEDGFFGENKIVYLRRELAKLERNNLLAKHGISSVRQGRSL